MRRREGGEAGKGLGEGYREGGDNQREKGGMGIETVKEALEEEDVRNPAFMLHKQLTFRKEENLKRSEFINSRVSVGLNKIC